MNDREKRIRYLYAICHQYGVDREDIKDIIESVCSLLGHNKPISELEDNNISVAAQLLQDYVQRIYRCRSGQDWKTGEVLPKYKIGGLNETR